MVVELGKMTYKRIGMVIEPDSGVDLVIGAEVAFTSP